MKQVLAALLFLIFISAQFGRISSYYHCILVNAVQKELKISCDCQKILSDSSAAQGNEAAVPVHTHPIAMEEYVASDEQGTLFNCPECLNTHNRFYINNYHSASSNANFVPPESCFLL
jgi:hypothetical protein